MKASLVSALLLASLPSVALAMDDHTVVKPDMMKWGAAPPALPPGAEVAVIAGNPESDGAYVVRVRMPADYKVMPHTHPADENVTVLSGTMNFAMGGTFDAAKGEVVPAGGFFQAPKGMQHYAWSSEPTVIQIHGMGPFAINYVNPADDPRNMAEKSSDAATTTGSK